MDIDESNGYVLIFLSIGGFKLVHQSG